MTQRGEIEYNTQMEKRELSFEDMQAGAYALATKIVESGYKPGIIVGLSRGGLVPAVMLSHILDVGMIPFSLSLRDNTSIRHEFDLLDGFGNILVVDDINDSGETLDLFDKGLIATQINKEANWKFATLYSKEVSKFTVDYYSELIPSGDNRWLKFPWEKTYGFN